MEELRNIAKLHYQAASPRVQQLARDFFNSMDEDGDKKVDVGEFLSFMSRQGYSHLSNRHFFKELDVTGNGALGFWEVMTLYYVMKSGRPICSWCSDFIPGIYFSCLQCFKTGKSFNLCCDCYHNPSGCTHTHADGAGFLDNYTLLQTIRESALAARDQANVQPSSSQAIVPVSASGKDIAFKALELATAIINAVGNIAVAVGSKCTIM